MLGSMHCTNGGGWWRARRVSVWVLLALACGKADDADGGIATNDSTESLGGSPAAADAAAPTGVDDAAAPADAGALPAMGDECPQLRRENCRGATRNPLWARVPPMSKCCAYENSCAFPLAWPAFPSQAECESSCRCQDVRGDIELAETLGAAATPTERTTFDCWCADNDCSMTTRTLAESVANACAVTDQPSTLSQLVGCGMVAVRFSGGFVGGSEVFDAASGDLIGMSLFSDVPRAPCRVYDTIIGTEFDCPEAVECALCDGTEPLLVCE